MAPHVIRPGYGRRKPARGFSLIRAKSSISVGIRQGEAARRGRNGEICDYSPLLLDLRLGVRAPEFEPASCPLGVPSHQFRDFYRSSAGFGDAFGETQVQLTDDLRSGRGGCLERAMPEHEFH